jgi:hypothetical protein
MVPHNSPSTFSPSGCSKRTIRVKKEESAFVYAWFESHDGVMSYSTLDGSPGSTYRDLELTIPDGMREEAENLLKQLGDLVYEIKPSGTLHGEYPG